MEAKIKDPRKHKKDFKKTRRKTAIRHLRYHGNFEFNSLERNKTDTKIVPLIYVVTPTYYRDTQMADLTGLSNTLCLIRKLHWIVVEDWKFTNYNIYEHLRRTNITFTYIAQRTLQSTPYLTRGVDQRNTALHWILKNHDWKEPAVVYFADDDNTYDLRIFEEMRYTKKLSMWPVAFSGKFRAERPIVKNGKVIGFHAWGSKYRKFVTDMAGFAINIKVLWDYYPMFFKKEAGMLESRFLERCCTLNDIEPLADNCSKVYAWHTKTEKPEFSENIETYMNIYV